MPTPPPSAAEPRHASHRDRWLTCASLGALAIAVAAFHGAALAVSSFPKSESFFSTSEGVTAWRPPMISPNLTHLWGKERQG